MYFLNLFYNNQIYYIYIYHIQNYEAANEKDNDNDDVTIVKTP